MTDNLLYYGDNLDVLRRYVKDESVDLVYLDPPFNSKATYNVLFGERNGSQAAAQIKAFEDTWQWDMAAAEAYQEIVEAGGRVSQAMQAFRKLLGESNMMAYLAMMAPRLIELRRVLKPTGSLYLHCDPTASHYLKVLMDAIFGPESYTNEIVWRRYKRPKGSQHRARKYGSSTDTILFYTKTDAYRFYSDRVKIPLDEETLKKRYTHSDEKGPYYSGPLLRSASMGPRPNLVYEYKGFTPGPEGWRMTKDKLAKLDAAGDMFWTSSGVPRRKVRPRGKPGRQADNLWVDIEALGSQAKERLGYPTQKPEALLERIILASSNEGDLVLDPFCGCGTTISVAQRLNRHWIGIDITHLAVGLMKHRLRDAFGDEVEYEVIGEPVSLPGARTLARQDPYQFQWWALGLVGARPVEQKKGSDKGIDGRLYFHDEGKRRGKTKQVIFSVKAGRTGVAHLRDLRGVVDREKAQIGVLLTMQEPTQPMRTEAASAGFYHSPGWNRDYPKLQLLTVAELLEGKGVDMPPLRQVSDTFRKAPKADRDKPVQATLPGT